jgi:hypothetical protein
MVRALAPVAPPCFQSRDQWTEYLSAFAAEQRDEHEPGPLVFTPDGVVLDADAGLSTAPPALNVPAITFKGRRVTFNNELNWCEDCSTAYRSQMTKEGRCNPNHLRELEPA